MARPPLVIEVTIPLTRGKVAIIDQADYHLVAPYRWYASLQHGKWYAVASVYVSPGVTTKIGMHAVIMSKDANGRTPDHKDHDGLNNRRSNLRFATASQQASNAVTGKNNASGYKGVQARGAKWSMTIMKDGATWYEGGFTSAEGAARAYDAKAKELHGEFAYLNFPQECTP